MLFLLRILFLVTIEGLINLLVLKITLCWKLLICPFNMDMLFKETNLYAITFILLYLMMVLSYGQCSY